MLRERERLMLSATAYSPVGDEIVQCNANNASLALAFHVESGITCSLSLL